MDRRAPSCDEKVLYKADSAAKKRRRMSDASRRISGRPLYVLTVLSVAFLLLVRHSFVSHQVDVKACNMSYMYPSYRHLHGFDHEHTRFASKYSLYLYREVTIDTNEEPQGVPVLFVPGNAGSYKQIRPIAAEAAAQFQQSLKDDGDILRRGKRSLDFFTVDFNEDFSAFHGQTMLDQAEYLNSAITYILSLYTDARKSPSFKSLPDPTSVIIIGHSMGGLVARLTQVMPNYLPKSINTILTMSTPHALPPAPFDGQIQTIYEEVNSFWHKSFSARANENPLQDVSLISIAGGGLDRIISSDYASVSTILPPTNGFTVYTSTIPDVWISADHQAILWCDQFRKVVARALLECVDARREGQTKALAERIGIFNRHFLSRLDGVDNTPSLIDRSRITISVDGSKALDSDRLMRSGSQLYTDNTDLVALPKNINGSLQVLTNLPLTNLDEDAYFAISLCRREVASLQLSDEVSSVQLSCVDVSGDLSTLPSQHDLSREGPSQRTYFLQFSGKDLLGHDFLAVRSRSLDSRQFVAVEYLGPDEVSQVVLASDMFGLFFGRLRLIIGATRSLSTTLRLNTILSSLISYKLRISPRSCKDSLMDTLLRQHTVAPYETKYYSGQRDIEISVHGQAPFFPPMFSQHQGLSLQYWSDPGCSGPIDIVLSVDYFGSLGKLVMRYRVVLVVYPLAMTLFVIWYQTGLYNRTGSYLSFQQGQRVVLRRGLLLATAMISILSIVLIWRQRHLNMSLEDYFSPGKSTQDTTRYVMHMNDKLLGIQDPFLWWLAPLFLVVSLGLLNVASLTLGSMIEGTGILLNMVRGSSRIAMEGTQRTLRRRIITTAILLSIVSFLVPYQFAYIVACIVQFSTCVRLVRAADKEATQKAYNFNFSILMLMVCVLPINLPILVVWVRNISVQWLTPFSSHHNVLSIAPIILLVETLANGNIAPPVDSSIVKFFDLAILVMASTILLYGVMYTYILHHVLNLLAGCIFLYQHFASHPASSSSPSSSSSSSSTSETETGQQ